MDGLRAYGWHNGHERDESTGVSLELLRIWRNFSDRQLRIRNLVVAVVQLQGEAERIGNGVPVIWHREIDVGTLYEATQTKVIAITASTAQEALEVWNKSEYFDC